MATQNKRRANDSILDLPAVQVHADFGADLELSVVWLLCGWHGKECTPTRKQTTKAISLAASLACQDARLSGVRRD